MTLSPAKRRTKWTDEKIKALKLRRGRTSRPAGSAAKDLGASAGGRIREVASETDDDYIAEWERWEVFKRVTNATRERGAEYVAKLLGITVIP